MIMDHEQQRELVCKVYCLFSISKKTPKMCILYVVLIFVIKFKTYVINYKIVCFQFYIKL